VAWLAELTDVVILQAHLLSRGPMFGGMRQQYNARGESIEVPQVSDGFAWPLIGEIRAAAWQ
jgi:hypothetical protein